MKYNIKQIKGKQNKHVAGKYQKHVQDFLTYLGSKNELGDIEPDELNNIGMVMVEGVPYSYNNLPTNVLIPELILDHEHTNDIKLPQGIKVESLDVYPSGIKTWIDSNIKARSVTLFRIADGSIPKSVLQNKYLKNLHIRWSSSIEIPTGTKNRELQIVLDSFSRSYIDIKNQVEIKELSASDVSEVKIGNGFKTVGSCFLRNAAIKGLGTNMEIEGNLILKYAKGIDELPRGLKVGRILNIEDTKIRRLPPDLIADRVVVHSSQLEADYIKPHGVKHISVI